MPLKTSSPAPVVVALADDHPGALRYAASEAVRDRRPLRVVHVLHPPRGGPGPESMLISFEAAEVVAERLLRDQYELARRLVAGAVPVERVLRRGPVVESLMEQCEDADHLVLQRRHAARLRRLLTGSTVAALAAHSPVPVVAVPELWSGPRATPHVTVALGEHDIGVRESTLLAQAFAEAETRDASLTVLHAWFLPAEYGEVTMANPTLEDWQDVARRDVEAHVTPWREAHPTVDVRVDVPHLRPADALLRDSRHSDLLLVGRRTHGLQHLGPVVRGALRESQCPVVVVGVPATADAGVPTRLSTHTG